MDTNFKKLQVWSFPNTVEKEATEDSNYWKHLQYPVTSKQPGIVSHIEFSPVEPHNYLATCSTRVTLYSPRTNAPLKSYHRFTDVMHSASFRPDGQLIVVGSDDKKIRVIHEKSFEQILEGHKRSVHLTKFLDNLKVFSGSDDKSVRLWDVATKSQISAFLEHTDYVRCGSKGASSELFITGSYDHTVKLFDARAESSVLTINHGDPVESVLMYPSAGVFASAGGNVVKVWDVASGGKLIASISNHHKSITGLCFSNDQKRLVSASLDRHVKFYDLSTNKITHSIDYPTSLLSLAISPEDEYIAVGSTDCMLSIRKRMTCDELDAEYDEKRKQRKRPRSGRALTMVEGRDVASSDVVVEHSKKEYLEKYNAYLKKYRHSKALDVVLNPSMKSKHPEVVISVMLELMRRDTLKAALAGRTDENLSVILAFLLKHFVPPYLNSVMDIVSVVLDVYQDKLSDMPQSLLQVMKLSQAAKDRVDFTCDGMEIVGIIKNILNTSNVAK